VRRAGLHHRLATAAVTAQIEDIPRMRVEVIQRPKIVTRCKRVMPTDLLRTVELEDSLKVCANSVIQMALRPAPFFWYF
jgi:hypothetical protein